MFSTPFRPALHSMSAGTRCCYPFHARPVRSIMLDMGSVHDFKEAQERIEEAKKPQKITFFSPNFTQDGSPSSATICVHVENGDVLGIKNQVIENGGIWNDEFTAFIPWPCAFILIEDDD
jgi:hypothetical protein